MFAVLQNVNWFLSFGISHCGDGGRGKANDVNDDDDMNTKGEMMKNREKSTHEASTQRRRFGVRFVAWWEKGS
jgi:hypothetical protein